jgi:hypothetical protein
MTGKEIFVTYGIKLTDIAKYANELGITTGLTKKIAYEHDFTKAEVAQIAVRHKKV